MVTASISHLLLCHVDNQKGVESGYNWNFTLYEYIRDEDVKDKTSSEGWKRLHMGGYSRRICETRANIVGGIICHCDDLKEWIAGKNNSRTKYTTKCLEMHKED